MAREALGVDIYQPGNTVDDVITKSRLLYGQRRVGRHGLKELAADFVDPEARASEADMQATYKGLTGKSDMKHDDSFYLTWRNWPAVVERYAIKDVEYTRALDGVLDPQLRADDKLYRLYVEVERPVTEVLYRAEQRGVHVNPEAVDRLRALYKQRAAAARVDLTATLGFVPEGEGSEEALREGLLGAGVQLTERTEKTGEYAVNRKALERFVDHPAVAALFEFRRVNKFLSTYIEPLSDKDHIHPTFNPAEAWTGRMSGSSPNMQNLPKRSEGGVADEDKVRSVFIPEPGFEFLIGDYESIEVFLIAYFLGIPEYKQLVAEGDPHARTAAVVWPQFGAWESFLKSGPNRWLRDIAKQVTYGIAYGGGGRVIAATINKHVLDAGHPELMVDEDQARAIRRKITDNIPGFKALTDTPWRGKQFPSGRIHQQLWNSAVIEESGTTFGYVRTLMGRKQWVQVAPEDKAYVGLSGLIQGSAADIMKAGAINVFEALKPYGGQPILFVHDEIVAQVPKGEGKHLLPIFVDAMEAAAQIDPQVRVEAHVTDRSYAHAD